jgi:guanine deaminase
MDQSLLGQAIGQSRESVEQGGFPVGVVIAIGGRVFAKGISGAQQPNDPTSHAEIAAIREACAKIGSRDLSTAVLYTSKEPCLMCYSACVWASIPRIVYACSRGKIQPTYFEGNHDLTAINAQSRKPIELVQLSELEQQAMDVIEAWEITVKTT